MVQRLTYRRRHPYATRSNKTRVVKTPGAEVVLGGQLLGIFHQQPRKCDCSKGIVSQIISYTSSS